MGSIKPLKTTKFTEMFTSVREHPRRIEIETKGKIPKWLTGGLVRVGPGKFEWGNSSYRHWFDGEALLHRFGFANGKITYSSSFLRSQSYLKSQAKCLIRFSSFGTMEAPDPCKNIFGRFMSYFVPPKRTDNANISVVSLKGDTYASTEISPVLYQIDANHLTTKKLVNIMEMFPGRRSWLAHPHVDEEGNYYNVSTVYMEKEYQICMIPMMKDVDSGDSSSALQGGRILAKIPIEGSPAYYHSFGMTANYFILVENPFYIRLTKLKAISMKLNKKSFLDLIRWNPKERTKIHLIDRRSGKQMCIFDADPFFTFHHVNAYEEGNEVVVDLCGYENANIVFQFYLHELRYNNPDITVGGKGFATASLRRYRLPLDTLPPENCYSDEPVQRRRLGRRRNGLDYETLHMGFEMPAINDAYSMKPYRFAYANGQSRAGAYFDQLVKVDLKSKEKLFWEEENCYPSEPIFVEDPEPLSEDDGVILSSVIGLGGRKSFLLVLNAITFDEIARAEIPYRMATTLHGSFCK